MTTEAVQTVRAFVAVEMPPEIRELLAEKQDELKGHMGRAAGAVRWVRPEGVHLTLQFLGDVPVGLVPRMSQALDEARNGVRPLKLVVSRVSAFPGIVKPRVIWIALEGDIAGLHTLEAAVSTQLQPLGFAPDKPFKPHVTLGRVRENVRPDELLAISQALVAQENKPIHRVNFTVNRVQLMESHLQRGGSVYTELAAVELG
jgi:RNA 2',3'-cyclic 3'-phosphodiesterase